MATRLLLVLVTAQSVPYASYSKAFLLKFSIVPMVTVWIMDRMGDGPIFSDRNKKKTFNNGGNNGRGLQKRYV